MFVLILQVLTAVTSCAGYKGATISCMCSTIQCVEHGMSTCNTTGMCFTQYLDRRDGSHPVVRGCISSRTPLLCENRRPAIAGGSWPVLLCCNSHLCNRDVLPTMPSWSHASGDDGTKQNDAAEDDDMAGVYNVGSDRKTLEELVAKSAGGQDVLVARDSSVDGDADDGENFNLLKKRRKARHPKIVSPVYITVLVLGVCSLVAIGIVATIVLRRNNRLYSEQYGALEHHHHHHHHHGCKKTRQPTSVTGDESELLHQAPVLVVYGNKVSGNT